MFQFEHSNPDVKAELTESFHRFLDSGDLVLGKQVSGFEIEFAKYLGIDYSLGVANGTEAIELALMALGAKRDSKVATVANAGFYTSSAALAIGATPVYMDVSLDDGLVAFDEVESTIKKEQPDVLVVTHLYGQIVPEVARMVELARSKGVKVLEDCAQAHGAQIDGRMAGTFGDVSSFSHYPTKNLGALGDGGSVATSSRALYERLVRLRQYGWESKYKVVELGRNSRLDELQAAFLRSRLPRLDESNRRRVSIAHNLSAGILEREGLIQHVRRDWHGGFVAHLFVMKVSPNHRGSLVKHLSENSVGSSIHYPIPDHLQPAMKFRNKPSLPHTEEWSKSVVTLPLFPSMSSEETQYVVDSVNSWDPLKSKGQGL
jgi:dTDP-4-amino-4,6-dideoxygalactose transaminase